MVILVILAIITILIAGWYVYDTTESENVKKRNKSFVVTIIFYTISIQLFSSAIQISLDKQNPSALDVYRDKTELKTVPFVGEMTIPEAEEYVKKGFISAISEDRTYKAEGLVCRPKVPLFNRRGERIIVKIKTCDYEQLNKKLK